MFAVLPPASAASAAGTPGRAACAASQRLTAVIATTHDDVDDHQRRLGRRSSSARCATASTAASRAAAAADLQRRRGALQANSAHWHCSIRSTISTCQLNQPHGNKKIRNGKIRNKLKTRICSEETVWYESVKSVLMKVGPKEIYGGKHLWKDRS